MRDPLEGVVRPFFDPARLLVSHAAVGAAATALPSALAFPWVDEVLRGTPFGYLLLPAVVGGLAALAVWVALRAGRGGAWTLFALCPFAGAVAGGSTLLMLMLPCMQEALQVLGFAWLATYPACFGFVAGLLYALTLFAPVAYTTSQTARDRSRLPKVGGAARAAIASSAWLTFAGAFAVVVGEPSGVSRVLGLAALALATMSTALGVRWLAHARSVLACVRAGVHPDLRIVPFDAQHEVLEQVVAWNATYRDPMPQAIPIALVPRLHRDARRQCALR